MVGAPSVIREESMNSHIAAGALAVVFFVTPASGQIFDLGKYPDWSGQWRRVPDGGPPRYDPSKPNGLGQQAPLKPEYQAMLVASLKDQAEGGQGLDVTFKCIPTGMPRMMSGVFPVEWVFTPNVTYMLSEFMIQAPRRIYTDGRPFPTAEEPTFVGFSAGKWLDTDGDGRFDTLEVETRNIKVPRTFDQAGIPLAEDGQSVVKERIFLDKANPDILHDEITTIDSALTRPWTVMKNYRRDRHVLWTENNCTEGNNYVAIGNDNYYLSGDGYLMPTKKGQQPPDLRYFKAAEKRSEK
jgi:hypothetical protein